MDTGVDRRRRPSRAIRGGSIPGFLAMAGTGTATQSPARLPDWLAGWRNHRPEQARNPRETGEPPIRCPAGPAVRVRHSGVLPYAARDI